MHAWYIYVGDNSECLISCHFFFSGETSFNNKKTRGTETVFRVLCVEVEARHWHDKHLCGQMQYSVAFAQNVNR